MYAETLADYHEKRKQFVSKIARDFPKFHDYLFGLRGYLTRDKEWVKVLRPLVAHGHMTNNVVER